MSLAWSSVKDSLDNDHDSKSGQDDSGEERRLAELIARYEAALADLQTGCDRYNNDFLEIAEQIGDSSATASEFGRIRYLSLKIHSEVQEMRGDAEDALKYALIAWKAAEPYQAVDESALLFRICEYRLCFCRGLFCYKRI